MVGDAVMLKVLDQHELPTVTMGPITVDGAAVTSLKEGETGTVTLMADRGTATDATPDGETIKVALTHGAASSASAADYSLSSETVTITATSGTFMLEVLADDVVDAEELVLQAAVTGEAMYGAAADTVDLGPISFVDGTTKLVYPKTDEELQAVIYPAKEAGMGDDMMFNPGRDDRDYLARLAVQQRGGSHALVHGRVGHGGRGDRRGQRQRHGDGDGARHGRGDGAHHHHRSREHGGGGGEGSPADRSERGQHHLPG